MVRIDFYILQLQMHDEVSYLIFDVDHSSDFKGHIDATVQVAKAETDSNGYVLSSLVAYFSMQRQLI